MTFDFNKLVTIGFDKWKTAPFRFYGEKEPFFIGNKIEQTWRDVILSGFTALTLVNAKEDGLNYLKLFGGTEQRNLPSEYTQVEYLESTGTQYIDLGDVLNTATDDIEIEMQLIRTEATNFFGARVSTTNKPYALATASGNWRWGWKNNSDASDVAINLNKHTLKIDHTNNTLSVDGTVIETKGVGVGNIETPTTPTLFAIHTTGSQELYLGSVRISAFRKWRNGELVQSVVSCRRNSDNVLGMYDLVNNTFFTNAGTGTFTAGAEAVPTPDTPMDIYCNNGVVKVSKNLFNKNDLNNGTYTDDTNTTRINAKINIGSAGYYTCSLSNNIGNFEYIISTFQKGTKIYVANIIAWATQPTTIQISANDLNMYDYVITFRCANETSINKDIFTGHFQFEKGSTATTYHPYGQIYTDGTVETVEVIGKNLFDKNGTFVEFNSAADYIAIPVKNGTYTCSTNIPLTGPSDANAWFDNQNTTFSSNINPVSSSAKRTVTTSNGYVYFAIRKSYKSGLLDGTYWVQIEQGSTATTYEEYFNGGTATAEMLLAIGNYQDVQEVLTGNVTRNVGIKVLDGTENWTAYNGGVYFPLGVGGSLPATTVAYCSHFSYAGAGILIANLPMGGFSIATNGNCSFKSSDTTTKADWVAWLATQYANGTPVIIIYPLATPTTETVTGQPINIQEGTNIVEITQASMDNLGLEVSYKAGVAVTITEIQNSQLSNQVTVTIGG